MYGADRLSSGIGRGRQVPARLTSKENLVMGAFSILYTINIAVSNLSLHLVTVPVSSRTFSSGQL